MKKTRYFVAGIVAGVAGVLILAAIILTVSGIGLNIISMSHENTVSEALVSEEVETLEETPLYDPDQYDEFEEKVTDILDLLDKYYYEDVDSEELYEEAVRGFVDSVGDPYTSYFTDDEYESFLEKMEGSYEGIGVVVSYGDSEDEIVVVAPFKDSPGEVAGMEPGDRIIAVDGVDVIGMDLDKVVERIKGEKGTEVVITVLRGEEEIQELDISIIRDVIEIPTIEFEMLEGNIGYIYMSGFDLITEEQFSDALKQLDIQGQDGMIIDLRNNPGGYLHIVYAIVDELLGKGDLVVYTEDKYGNREELITETRAAFNKPLIVLVNGNSASASEILAGAIQDHEKGIIMGETTFGKGLVQRTFDLDDGSAVKITVSRYYTPDGSYIHGVGIEPDIIVEYDPESEEDNQLNEAIKVMKDMINNQ